MTKTPAIWRTCVTTGCNNRIRSDNKSGFCQSHENQRISAVRQTPEGRARAWESTKSWRKRNPQATRRTAARWRDNPERRQEATLRTAQWQKANPTRVRAHGQSRRSKKERLYVERVDHDTIWERDDGACHLCGLRVDVLKWELDHVIPLDADGPHCVGNAAVACRDCNRRKGRRTVCTDDVVWKRAIAAFTEFHGTGCPLPIRQVSL
jgi:5-methylcytosine-specific restriction endonuclease McrA